MFEILSDDEIMDVYDTTLVNGDQNKIGVASRDAKRAIATAQRDKDIREVVGWIDNLYWEVFNNLEYKGSKTRVLTGIDYTKKQLEQLLKEKNITKEKE